MKEQTSGEIKIETDFFIFNLFLEYIYTGEIKHSNLSSEQLLELLSLAESHFLPHLKSYLQTSLLKYIDFTNVASFYTLADQLHANYLKETCFRFMLKNYKKLVTEKSGEEIPDSLQKQLKKFLKL